MAMRRHHRGGAPPAGFGDSSSDDEEDAFSAMSRKSKRAKTSCVPDPAADTSRSDSKDNEVSFSDQHQQPTTVAATTSSMKRHHKNHNNTRKAKMDALLMELEEEKAKVATSAQLGANQKYDSRRGGGLEKKGSYVQPGEEHLTTNIFVGNLAPRITEEELTDLFRQFGDLYSVKIMWPRTPEERARNRHTGFVCFMHRRDAEDAMEACNETDPFQVGRLLMMRWGKNVKKIVKQGTGGIPIAPILKRDRDPLPTPQSHQQVEDQLREEDPQEIQLDDQERLPVSKQQEGDKISHSSDESGARIQVVAPDDSARVHLITTVASFVAKDGAQLEQKLLDIKGNDPAFSFLRLPTHCSPIERQEYIYYRWRVYSFCQGNSLNQWRTEPFRMFHKYGALWIPPPLDAEAAAAEVEAARRKEEMIQRQRQERRFQNLKRDYVTGRQLEQAKRRGGQEGMAELTSEECIDFDRLCRKQLCASRESICQAMAFCFEKSAAAWRIAEMIKGLLLEVSGPSVETRIARLYLLSDILFNSQQPGVKNAFIYRDAIERMGPEVFSFLGNSSQSQGLGGDKATSTAMGRITRNKLATAVAGVLAAWTRWNVYNPQFIEELHARFDGRKILKEEEDKEKHNAETETEDESQKVEETPEDAGVILDRRRGDFVAVSEDIHLEEEPAEFTSNDKKRVKTSNDGTRGDALEANEFEDDADGEPLDDENVDGEPLGGDVDGAPLEEGEQVKMKQEQLASDHGGNSSEEDADGEPLDDDGEPLDEDLDGEPIDGEPLEQ